MQNSEVGTTVHNIFFEAIMLLLPILLKICKFKNKFPPASKNQQLIKTDDLTLPRRRYHGSQFQALCEINMVLRH